MNVVIATGAGVSAASGLGTYRGEGGLWVLHPELEEKSSAKHILSHHDELWEYWGLFRHQCMGVLPNYLHWLVADFQRWGAEHGHRVTVVTQNVDGLHQTAGTTDVVELHGNIFRSVCIASRTGGRGCPNKAAWEDHLAHPTPCPQCGGPTRPDIVLFGEKVPAGQWAKAQGACLRATHYIATGTSGMVVPASELVTVAKDTGAVTYLANKEAWEHPHPDFDITMLGDAADLLTDIFRRLADVYGPRDDENRWAPPPDESS